MSHRQLADSITDRNQEGVKEDTFSYFSYVAAQCNGTEYI